MGKRSVSPAVKAAGLIISALIMAFNCLPQMDALRKLPDDVYIDAGSRTNVFEGLEGVFSVTDAAGTEVSGDMSERLGNGAQNASCSIELLGIPVKTVNVHVRDEIYVMPGGETVGLSIYCDGVMVAGLGTIETENGKVSPAQEAGIKPGDVISAVDGVRIGSIDALLKACNQSDRIYELKIKRGEEEIKAYITPKTDISGSGAKLGMWVRESSAGIGTLSFYVMNSLSYGALGHAVTDPDTGTVIPARDGKITKADVVGITQGKQGSPGELRGTFGTFSRKLGNIIENTSYGVYGTLEEEVVNPLYPEGIPLAYPEEIREGHAQILASIDETGVKAYDCEIIRVYSQPLTESKGIVIRITDRELLEKTGGIIQGMSGSPLIQNGKLAGAVTHVFINDPEKGYAIYAYWMYERIAE